MQGRNLETTGSTLCGHGLLDPAVSACERQPGRMVSSGQCPSPRCGPAIVVYPESNPNMIRRITLDAKQAGKRSAENPRAAFDEAGAGNGATTATAPVLDPTDERGAETKWMVRSSETPTRKGGNGQGSRGLEPSPRRPSTLPTIPGRFSLKNGRRIEQVENHIR